MTKVAAIQMISTPSVHENIATAGRLIADAATQGAELVLLPEYWAILGMHETDKFNHAETLGSGPIQDFMADAAKRHKLWLVGGTLPLMSLEDGKVFNNVLVYNPQGERVARYDKIHLFSFNKGTESYDEARTIIAGNSIASFDSPFGKIGLSVCYDLRFPELFRALGHCTLITLPAAFIHTTGQAHWEILLRARAIENQCYVLASDQGGIHDNGRHTWGHSMLIDPWGEIISVLPQGEGVVIGDINPNYLDEVRTNLPALKHRQL
jgi:deaminated glutathione amidase